MASGFDLGDLDAMCTPTLPWRDRIRILGNGVVPQQAALALALLVDALDRGME